MSPASKRPHNPASRISRFVLFCNRVCFQVGGKKRRWERAVQPSQKTLGHVRLLAPRSRLPQQLSYSSHTLLFRKIPESQVSIATCSMCKHMQAKCVGPASTPLNTCALPSALQRQHMEQSLKGSWMSPPAPAAWPDQRHVLGIQAGRLAQLLTQLTKGSQPNTNNGTDTDMRDQAFKVQPNLQVALSMVRVCNMPERLLSRGSALSLS